MKTIYAIKIIKTTITTIKTIEPSKFTEDMKKVLFI